MFLYGSNTIQEFFNVGADRGFGTLRRNSNGNNPTESEDSLTRYPVQALLGGLSSTCL